MFQSSSSNNDPLALMNYWKYGNVTEEYRIDQPAAAQGLLLRVLRTPQPDRYDGKGDGGGGDGFLPLPLLSSAF
jgi:hypothetical protein